MYEFLGCRAGDYMVASVQTISEQSTIGDALGLFEQYDFNMFPVVDGSRLCAVLSKFDVLSVFALTPKQIVPSYEEVTRSPISQVMTRDFTSVDPQTPLTRVLQLMIEKRINSVPVLDQAGALVGVLSRTDILAALKKCTSRSD
jgi:CBS domain-containing protein